jgi:hypothetical protein
MKTLFAMRRANGDWFALDDHGSLRVPVFASSGEAMLARSRETGMECFRPVALDEAAFSNLTKSDDGKASFWLVADPLLKLSHGRQLDRKQLEQFLMNSDGPAAINGINP